MSLEFYEQKFQSLNLNKTGDRKSPHKVAMLLAVLDAIDAGEIKDNKIYFNQDLKERFTKQFDLLKSDNDRNNPHLPFFHLRTSGFWFFKPKPGKSNEFSSLRQVGGPGVLDKYIDYAFLDDELFELLSFEVVRQYLSKALHSNLSFNPTTRDELLDVGKGWNWLECEAAVASYFEMLVKEITNQKYVKSHHRRALAEKLSKRSEKSVEYKYQNISAVLIEMGLPYIAGYKPAFNYQKQLSNTVLAYIAAQPELFDKTLEQVHYSNKSPYAVTNSLLDDEIPERITTPQIPNRKFIARKTNFVQREANNRALGEDGEKLVLNFEKHRLTELGRSDLAEEVVWASKDEGDGLGYDVRSFSVDNRGKEDELFVEVKTTNSGKYQPFYISDNEVTFSKQEAKRYALYRVYEFRAAPRFFVLPGSIEKHVNLSANNYRASFN